MALARLANEQVFTGSGPVNFYVVTRSLVRLQWQNSLNNWVTLHSFNEREAFSLAMETEVNYRFQINDAESYVESQVV
jgi:hypothetical protein